MKKTETIKKLIDLPFDTASGLKLLAAKKNTDTKPYMEEVLISHEKKNSKRDKNGKLI